MPWRHSGTISSGPYAGRWRTGLALQTLGGQIDAAWPTRWSLPKAVRADGTLGDTSHQNRSSDHNPNIVDGSYRVVLAIDITDYDPIGQDMAKVTEALRLSKDPRIKYVIHFRGGGPSMFSSYATSSYPAWTWRPYSGTNPHTSHAHISLQSSKSRYDDTTPFKINKEISMAHPPSSLGQYRKDHDVGVVPEWSPWLRYMQDGGTSVKASAGWPVSRFDLAWYNYSGPLAKLVAEQGRTIANLGQEIQRLREDLSDAMGRDSGDPSLSGKTFTATIK